MYDGAVEFGGDLGEPRAGRRRVLAGEQAHRRYTRRLALEPHPQGGDHADRFGDANPVSRGIIKTDLPQRDVEVIGGIVQRLGPHLPDKSEQLDASGEVRIDVVLYETMYIRL